MSSKTQIKLKIYENEIEIKSLKHEIRKNKEMIETNEHDLMMPGWDYDSKMSMKQEIDDLEAEIERLERQKRRLERENQMLQSGGQQEQPTVNIRVSITGLFSSKNLSR